MIAHKCNSNEDDKMRNENNGKANAEYDIQNSYWIMNNIYDTWRYADSSI